MKTDFALNSFKDQLENLVNNKDLPWGTIGISQVGPILDVKMGFEPRRLWSDFYKASILEHMQSRVKDITHKSARIYSDLTDLQRGVISVSVNTVPDYCTTARLVKAFDAILEIIVEHRKVKIYNSQETET